MRRRIGGLVGWVCVLAICGSTAVAVIQRNAIVDWYALRNYQAPAEVSQLAVQTTMTPKAAHLFYINHPGVEDKTSFRQHCDQFGEQTIILGCYIGVERGIHVLAVQDVRLQGVEQVTAAHEMLHAAYDRLSGDERQKVDAMLQDYADHQLKDERLIKILQTYQKTEPGQQLNEMHSIFGSEIANLPAGLADYYQQYFTDRQAVTSFAAQYQAAFTSRQDTINQYDSQLKALNSQIKGNTASLTSQAAALEAERQQLSAWRQSGDIARYNANVAAYNGKVDAYNSLLAQTKAEISQYNTLVNERNQLAAETAELQKAIDSSSLPTAK
jgi:uncharacterized protein YukE